MAHTISNEKRIRQNERRRRRNRSIRSLVHTSVKRVLAAVEKKDAAAARTFFQTACGTIDKAAAGGILHRNAAARKKSRLALRINALTPSK